MDRSPGTVPRGLDDINARKEDRMSGFAAASKRGDIAAISAWIFIGDILTPTGNGDFGSAASRRKSGRLGCGI
jgi:hypothetical protein